MITLDDLRDATAGDGGLSWLLRGPAFARRWFPMGGAASAGRTPPTFPASATDASGRPTGTERSAQTIDLLDGTETAPSAAAPGGGLSGAATPAQTRLRELEEHGPPEGPHGFKGVMENLAKVILPSTAQIFDRPKTQYYEQLGLARQRAADEAAATKSAEQSKLRGAQTFEAQSRGAEAEARAEKLKQAPGDKFERIENGQAIFTRQNGTSYAKPIEGYTAPRPNPPKGELDEWLAQHPGKTVDDFMARRAALSRKPEEPKTLSPGGRAEIEGRKNSRLTALERQYRQSQGGTNPMSAADLEQQKQQIQNEYEGELQAGGARVQHFTYGTPGGGGDTVEVINAQGVRGTIPRANLQKALDRGYKLANQ